MWWSLNSFGLWTSWESSGSWVPSLPNTHVSKIWGDSPIPSSKYRTKVSALRLRTNQVKVPHLTSSFYYLDHCREQGRNLLPCFSPHLRYLCLGDPCQCPCSRPFCGWLGLEGSKQKKFKSVNIKTVAMVVRQGSHDKWEEGGSSVEETKEKGPNDNATCISIALEEAWREDKGYSKR